MSTKKNICFNCRQRKVRCDGNLDGCRNCVRLCLECSFEAKEDPQTATRRIHLHNAFPELYTQAGTARKRARMACKACNSHKLRCSSNTPACQRCLKKQIECEYPVLGGAQGSSASPSGADRASVVPGRDGARIGASVSGNSTPAREPQTNDGPGRYAEILGCSTESIQQYIDAYFQYTYCLPYCGFPHRADLMHKWTSGTLNPILLKAMCSVSIGYLSLDEHARLLSLQWADEAEIYVLQTVATPSVVLIQILVLVLFQRGRMREIIKAQVLVALAARLAFLLGLNYEIPKLGTTSRELRRRLMWSIFTLDKLHSGGLSELSLCRVENIHIQLPCDEQSFTLGIHSKTPSLRAPDPALEGHDSPNSSMGTMSYLIRLVDVRDRILGYTRWLHVQKSLPPDFESQFAAFEAELGRFQSGLPESLVMNPRNFRLRGYTSSRTGYIMLHVWLNQCYCDLYRPMIPHLRESLDETKRQLCSHSFAQHCKDQALQHALSILDIFAWARKVSNPLSIADGAAAYCAHQATSIIVTMWKLNGNHKADEATATQDSTRLLPFLSVLADLEAHYLSVPAIRQDIQDIIESGRHSDLAGSRPLPSPEAAPKADPDMPRLEVLSSGSKYGILELYRQLYIRVIQAECEEEPASTHEYDTGPAADTLPGSGVSSSAKPPTAVFSAPLTTATTSAPAGEASLGESDNDEAFRVPTGHGLYDAGWSEWNTSLFTFNAMDLDNLDGIGLPAFEAMLHPYQSGFDPRAQGEQWYDRSMQGDDV